MFSTEQIENIQIDFGMVFVNYGETSQAQLGLTRGGSEFSATKLVRDIEFDGRKGKTKGLQVIDEINAMLKTVIMDTSVATLSSLMPHLDLVAAVGETPAYITNADVGVIPDAKYLKNVTMFAKVLGGGYKKISLFNALAENDLVLAAKPKGEGEVSLEIHAHWEVGDGADQDKLFKVEDVAAIAEPPVA